MRLTHADRVLFPDAGVTKRDLARYYEAVADWILPHLEDRPLTLVRCPGAVGDDCFFMKHSQAWSPDALRRVRIRERRKVGEYLIADSLDAVIALVQLGVTEIHTWNAKFSDLERPDRLVFDIDPGPEVAWPEIVAAARLVRQVLHGMSLRAFPKTTGGRGVHLVVPLAPGPSWDECLQTSRTIAEAIERHDPKRFTTKFAKAGRKRKILIDYLRNNRASTSVAAYSTRRRPNATVSVPLRWDELTTRVRPDSYTVGQVVRRLDRVRTDPWQDYWLSPQRLPALAPSGLP